MGHPLIHKLEAMPPGSLVPRDWMLDELRAADERTPAPAVPWLSVKEAAGILYEDGATDDDLRVLRARCARWHRMQLQGRRPKVRVRKAGPSDRSPWALCPSDVWDEAERLGLTGPKIVRPAAGNPLVEDEPLDEDRLAALCVHAATRNIRPR